MKIGRHYLMLIFFMVSHGINGCSTNNKNIEHLGLVPVLDNRSEMAEFYRRRKLLPENHILRNSSLTIVRMPSGNRLEGAIYLHKLAKFILGTDTERDAAASLLSSLGYGENGIHYLYAGSEDEPCVADNHAFKTRDEALLYLAKKNVSAALFLSSDSTFPAAIPSEITHYGTAFRALSDHK